MDNIRFDPRRSWQLVALVVLMSSGGFLSSAYADTFVTGSANGITCSGISDGSEAGISSIEKSCSDSSTFASQAASFAAYAMPGKLGVSVSYSISGRSDRAANNYGGRTHVYASDVEQLTIMSRTSRGFNFVRYCGIRVHQCIDDGAFNSIRRHSYGCDRWCSPDWLGSRSVHVDYHASRERWGEQSNVDPATLRFRQCDLLPVSECNRELQ